MKTEYVKLRDVMAVFSKYYKEVAQYSPRQERLLVLIKNDIKALETYTLDSSATFNQYGDNPTHIENVGNLTLNL